MSRPKLPKGLTGTRGSTLWRRVVSDYELRADELVILEDACRAVVLVDTIAAELDGAPLMVAGSRGQEREHPLLGELRHQRALVAALLRQLGLPDDPTTARDGAERSAAGRALARQRWSM